ncbi:MFS transporter [Paenibacillus rubinfantis]|uniref:MFS transporter n=1 Tax=Paenibacillus rubinfantis TaxID=1720296 RepID=UPI00073F6D32|nr:MFS transporter [Paenibacillus rubinfantis]
MSQEVRVKSQPLSGFKELAVYRSFVYLLLARVISRFGDSIDSIAYSWMVYMLTGSKLMIGTLFALNFIPNIAFSFFAGTLVDRWSKKKVVAITYLGRGLIVCFTAFLYWQGWLVPWHLYVLTLLTSTLECFASPAELALVPQLLPKEKLLSGNSFSTSASRAAELAGMAAVGGIIATLGISTAILIDGLTFTLAAAFIVLIRGNRETSPSTQPINASSNTSFVLELKEGLLYLKSNPLLITIVIAAALVNFCLSPFNVLNVVYVDEILGAGPAGLSLMGISLICGTIVSGLWIGKRGAAYKKSRLILTGYLLLGANYTLMYLPAVLPLQPLAMATLFSFGMGLSVSLCSTPSTTYFMETVPKELLGRVGALYGMVCTCAIPAGSALAGVLGEWVQVHLLYVSFGVLLLIPILLLMKQRRFMEI